MTVHSGFGGNRAAAGGSGRGERQRVRVAAVVLINTFVVIEIYSRNAPRIPLVFASCAATMTTMASRFELSRCRHLLVAVLKARG